MDIIIKKCDTCRIIYKDFECSLEYTSVKDDFVRRQISILRQKGLIKTEKNCFANTFKFSSHDTNKFILLLRRGFYLYEYMDDWEKFNEALLTEDFFQ